MLFILPKMSSLHLAISPSPRSYPITQSHLPLRVLLKLQKEQVSLPGAQTLCCSSVPSFIPLHCPWSPTLATCLLLGISSPLWAPSSSSLKKCSHRDSTLAVAIDDKVLPKWLSSTQSAYQCRRLGFDPWVRKIPWRRKWLCTPVLLPEQSQGQRSLASYSPWGRKRAKHDQTTTVHDNPLSFLLAIQQEFPSIPELLVSTSWPPVWFLHNFSTW